MADVPAPRADRIQAAANSPFPVDDLATAPTCEQVERCAALDVEESDLAAAWTIVDAWPFPRHGAPRAKPS